MTSLGELNPEYFYVDESGRIKKLIYCCLCLAGPYKPSEEKKKFISRGKSGFCLSCAQKHNFFNDPSLNQKVGNLDSIPSPTIIPEEAEDLKEDLI